MFMFRKISGLTGELIQSVRGKETSWVQLRGGEVPNLNNLMGGGKKGGAGSDGWCQVNRACWLKQSANQGCRKWEWALYSRSGHLTSNATLTKERNVEGGAYRFVGVETELHFWTYAVWAGFETSKWKSVSTKQRVCKSEAQEGGLSCRQKWRW